MQRVPSATPQPALSPEYAVGERVQLYSPLAGLQG